MQKQVTYHIAEWKGLNTHMNIYQILRYHQSQMYISGM